MVTKDILKSAVLHADGTYWLITTPERYYRDIEPGANVAFVFTSGAALPADLEVSVVLSSEGAFLRWCPVKEYYEQLGDS